MPEDYFEKIERFSGLVLIKNLFKKSMIRVVYVI
jgi:hypothetical protein